MDVGRTDDGSGPSPREVSANTLPFVIAGLLAAIAGGVHGTLAPSHARETTILGVAFAAVAVVQLVSAALLVQRPGRRVLEVVAAGNVALVLAWAASRTVGLPVGARPWSPEPIGLLDVSTMLVELACLYTCLALRSDDPPPPTPRVARLMNVALAAVGAFGLFLLMAAQTHADHGGSAAVHQTGHLVHAALLASAVGLVFTARAVVGGRRRRGHAGASLPA